MPSILSTLIWGSVSLSVFWQWQQILLGLVWRVQIKKRMLKNRKIPNKITRGLDNLNFTKRTSLFTLPRRRLQGILKNIDDINNSRGKILFQLKDNSGHEYSYTGNKGNFPAIRIMRFRNNRPVNTGGETSWAEFKRILKNFIYDTVKYWNLTLIDLSPS